MAGDDGTCPSGSTVNGSPCAAIAPLYSTQAYSLIVHGGNLTINLNGATLQGAYPYTLFNAASPSSPAMIVCVSARTCTNFNIDGGGNGKIINAFIDILAPGLFSFSNISNITLSLSGFPFMAQYWDSSKMSHVTMTTEAGIAIGGWYYNRGNLGSSMTSSQIESGGYADGFLLDDVRYNGLGHFLANHANTDNYFYTYIYQGQNQSNGRMVDIPGTSSPNGANSLNTVIPFRGAFGQASMLYGRYGRTNNGPSINNFQTKGIARSFLVANAALSVPYFNIIGGEGNASCDDGIHSVGDPGNCPDPWGTGGLTAGFLNPLAGMNLGTIISLGSGAQTRYVSDINSPGPSTIIIGSLQNQLVTTGRGGTPGAPDATGKIASFGFQNADLPAGNRYVNNQWALQDIPNYNVSYGGVWDVSHNGFGTVSTAQFAFQVPYLSIKNMPTPPCDAASIGYSGHAGWLNFVAGGSGVADTASICTKDSSGAYAWRSIMPATGFTGTKTAGTCALTIASGIITNVAGC